MAKKSVIAKVCITSSRLRSQHGTVPSYSYFGIVGSRSKEPAEYPVEGSVGRFADSGCPNQKNPTTYSGLGVRNRAIFCNTIYTVSTTFATQDSGPNGDAQSNSVTPLEYVRNLSVGMDTASNRTFRKGNEIGPGASNRSFKLGHAPSSTNFTGMSCKAGLGQEKMGMPIITRKINNFGITFGLPKKGSFSDFNLDFEENREGSEYADSKEENYFKINSGLSLDDIWFRKRRIN